MDGPLFVPTRRIALVTVTGWGDYGRNVVTEVRELASLLPSGFEQGLRFADGDPAQPDELCRLRTQVASREVIDALQQDGWEVEGQDAGRYSVCHLLVGDVADAAGMLAAAEAVQREHPGDTFRFTLRCTNANEVLGAWPLPDTAPAAYLVSPTSQSDLALDEQELVAIAAGAILTSLAPEGREELSTTRGGAGAFGFAGYYGLAGALRRRLAESVARALVESHLAGRPVREASIPEPQGVTAFLERFSPRPLALALFDPRRLGELRPEPIPARAAWAGGETLQVTLDRGAFAAELRRGEELHWSRRIRRLSRTLDMSLATLWRQQLGRAASDLCEELRQRVVSDFRGVLETLPYAPAWAERLLAEIDKRLAVKRSAMGSAGDELEPALAALDAAVAARPNPLVLAARMALWVAPALIAAGGILAALYPDLRAPAFTTGLVAGGLALAAGAVVLRIHRAHRAVMRARNRALAVVLGRQEALLSQNAIAYLADVLATLRQELDQARHDLESHRRALGETALELEKRTAEPLAESRALAPVIARPEEIAEAHAALAIDLGTWLLAWTGSGALAGLHDPSSAPTLFLDRTVAWCEARILAGTALHVPAFGHLWAIRKRQRGSGTVEQALASLWRRAAPCVTAPLAGDEAAAVLAPADIHAELTRAELPCPPDQLHEASTMPLLCCLRHGPLRILGRAAT